MIACSREATSWRSEAPGLRPGQAARGKLSAQRGKCSSPSTSALDARAASRSLCGSSPSRSPGKPPRPRDGWRADRRESEGHQVSKGTLAAADWMIMVTSLPPEAFPTADILALYHLRWRIELGFKRLKSLIGLKGPPGADERSARPYVLAHLLIILLLEPQGVGLRTDRPADLQNSARRSTGLPSASSQRAFLPPGPDQHVGVLPQARGRCGRAADRRDRRCGSRL